MLTITVLCVVLVYIFLTACTDLYMQDRGYWRIACLFGGLMFPVVAPILLMSHLKDPNDRWNLS